MLLGIGLEDAVFYPEYSKDSHLTGDRGNTISTEYRNTPSQAARARLCAWEVVQKD